jgi:transcriptional regulator with XRE-family HTH domain
MDPDPAADGRSLAEVLRAAREARGWSLEETATRAHIKPLVLYNLEEGLEDAPSGAALFFLARALELDHVTLLKRAGHLREW